MGFPLFILIGGKVSRLLLDSEEGYNLIQYCIQA